VQNTIQFVVKTIVPIEHTSTHGLFGHLTLIHVTRRLIVIQKRNVLWKNRKIVCGRILCVKTLRKIDVGTYLLKRTQPLSFVQWKVLNRSQVASWSSSNENHRVDCILEMTFFHESNFSLFWYFLSLYF